MKLTGYKLRRLVESVLHEADKPKEQSKGHALTTSKTPASDNKKAILVKNDGGLKALLKSLGTKYSGPYYVWADSDSPGAGGDGLKKAGSFYSPGAGDPYTYEKVSGDKYRVVSGPLNKGKYKSGKTIGARPIGATFTMSKPPKPIPPPEPQDDDWIEELTFQIESAKFNCAPQFVNSYKESLGSAISKSLKQKNSIPMTDRIASVVEKARTDKKLMSQYTLQSSGQWIFLFTTNCSGDYEKAVRVYNNMLDFLSDQGLKDTRNSMMKESTPLPHEVDQEVKGQASAKNEGLSRGSLYRRRYHGRY